MAKTVLQPGVSCPTGTKIVLTERVCIGMGSCLNSDYRDHPPRFFPLGKLFFPWVGHNTLVFVSRARFLVMPRMYTPVEHRANLAVYKNPWSQASSNPKIPDNKAFHSCGVRLQQVGECTLTGSVGHILLFPGLNNGVCLVGFSTPLDPVLPYTHHGLVSAVDGLQPDDSTIHKWRLVSQGMKLSLLNTGDHNDGWFESVRINANDLSSFAPLTFPGARLVIGSALSAQLPCVDITKEFARHPTYSTGKLSIIDKYLFNLQPQGADHDFQVLPKLPSIDSQVDNDNWDCVYVRIHGRNQPTFKTSLLVHVVSNQEIIYDEESTMSRYHSNSPGNRFVFEQHRSSQASNPNRTASARRTFLPIESQGYQTPEPYDDEIVAVTE